METTMGAWSHFVSDEYVVTQDPACLISARVETLIVEFDQVVYGRFLQGFATSVKPTGSFQRTCTPSSAPFQDAH